MLFSKQSAKGFAPRRHVHGICAFRVLCTCWILSLMRAAPSEALPRLASSFRLSVTLSHILSPGSILSPYPSNRLRWFLDQKTALIWFSRLTFRAPGAWQTLSSVSSSRLPFPILFLPSPLSSARDQVRRRDFRFSMPDKKKSSQARFAEKARAVDRCNFIITMIKDFGKINPVCVCVCV